jgi:hypothetical protein
MKRANKSKDSVSPVEHTENEHEKEEKKPSSFTLRNRSSYSSILKRIIIVLLILVVLLKVVGFLFDWDEESTANLSPQVKEYRKNILQALGMHHDEL